MKTKITIFIAGVFLFLQVTITKSQTTAIDFYGLDCDGNMHNMLSELDAGKAVLLHFYMPNCSSCPPPALNIQAMANKIMTTHPGMITGYAFPFQNSTTCSYSSSWTSSNGLSLYAPMDSGAYQVAYYGGFGMPTVVLLGGADHRIMFSTLSFSSSDTTIMRDSILNLFNSTSFIQQVNTAISSVQVYPNPASDKIQMEFNILQSSELEIQIVNSIGELISKVFEGPAVPGILRKEFGVANLSKGLYFVRVYSNGKSEQFKFTVGK